MTVPAETVIRVARTNLEGLHMIETQTETPLSITSKLNEAINLFASREEVAHVQIKHTARVDPGAKDYGDWIETLTDILIDARDARHDLTDLSLQAAQQIIDHMTRQNEGTT